MRNLSLHKLFLLAFTSFTLLQSCKDDSYLLTPPATPNQSYSEEFDSVPAALARGWKIINASFPKGGGVWQNGGDALAPIFNPFSQQGSFAGFVGSSVTATRTPVTADAAPYALAAPSAPQGFINDWLISPEKIMQNGDKIIFYTKAQILPTGQTINGGPDSTDFGNRLQVRINTHGTDLLIGDIKPLWQWLYTTSPTEAKDNPGNYDVVVLDINPFLNEWHKQVPATSLIDGRPFDATTNVTAFPTKWTRFEATVSGLDRPTLARFAFRYYVPGGDPNNGYATAIGIDKVEYKSVGY